MRILANVTKQELDRYAGQPTAKAMHDRVMQDAVQIPEGDKTAAAVFMASRKAEKAVNNTDTVEISRAGQALNQSAAETQESAPRIAFGVFRKNGANQLTVSFDNMAMASRAVKQGYIEVDGKRVDLSDDVKKRLAATSQEIQKARERVAMENAMRHNAAVARQQGDAMKQATDKMTRAVNTASRIMHGKKVSPADEKELMETNPELYAVVKNAAELAKHRRKQDDAEDERVSAANDEARAREAEPKDYSVEEVEMPRVEVQMDISFEGDTPKVLSVGAGLRTEG